MAAESNPHSASAASSGSTPDAGTPDPGQPGGAAVRPYRRNHYRLLHVQPEAPLEVIKASYRTLMSRLRMHPDLGGNHEEAALINEAYAVLCDPALRQEYDRQLRWRQRLDLMRHRMSESTGPGAQPPDPAPGAASDGFRPGPWTAGAARRPSPPFAHRAARQYAEAAGAAPATPPAACRQPCAFCGTANPMPRGENVTCMRCSAPLTPVRPLSPHPLRGTAVNRRSAIRRGRQHETVAYWGSPPRRHWVRWRDLSANGLSLWTPVALAVGQRLHVVDQDLQTVAEVVACEAGPSGWLVRARMLTLRVVRQQGLFCSTQA